MHDDDDREFEPGGEEEGVPVGESVAESHIGEDKSGPVWPLHLLQSWIGINPMYMDLSEILRSKYVLTSKYVLALFPDESGERLFLLFEAKPLRPASLFRIPMNFQFNLRSHRSFSRSKKSPPEPARLKKSDFGGGLSPYISVLASFSDKIQSLEP
jgi:hypothetical protein